MYHQTEICALSPDLLQHLHMCAALCALCNEGRGKFFRWPHKSFGLTIMSHSGAQIIATECDIVRAMQGKMVTGFKNYIVVTSGQQCSCRD